VCANGVEGERNGGFELPEQNHTFLEVLIYTPVDGKLKLLSDRGGCAANEIV
jgi:hypothetical protein